MEIAGRFKSARLRGRAGVKAAAAMFQVAVPERSPKIDVDVKTADAGSWSAGGSVLDSALYNLNIAQQYIDETAYLAEHRLISFHHGIALLARYRSNPEKLVVAHQCLTDAANWQIRESDRTLLGDSYLLIVCEAHYNLGVIEEVRKNYQRAIDHYDEAIKVDQKRGELRGRTKSEPPTGVLILARFGKVSASVSILGNNRLKGPDDWVSESAEVTVEGVLKDLRNLRGKLKFTKIGAPIAERLSPDSGPTGGLAAPRAAQDASPWDPFLEFLFPSRRKEEEEGAEKSEVPIPDEKKPEQNLTLRRIARKLDEMEKELMKPQ